MQSNSWNCSTGLIFSLDRIRAFLSVIITTGVNKYFVDVSGNANPTANARLLQQAMQYILLLQQQQQQQQQAAAAAAAQAQQNAVLSQIFSSFQSNPAAYLSLLQQVWSGAAATTPNNTNTPNQNNSTKK